MLRASALALLFVTTASCSADRPERGVASSALASRRALRTASLRSVESRSFVVEAPITPMTDGSDSFVMRRPGATAFFTPRGFSLSLASADRNKGWGLHARLAAAHEVAPIGEQPRAGKVNTYTNGQRHTGLPTFGQLAWEEIKPGVDMVVEPARGGFSYKFVLSPGADPSALTLEWSGATSLRATDDGRGVDIATGIGVVHVGGLRAFVVEGNHKRELPARHVVRGTSVAVVVDGYRGDAPLIVDPTVSFSSYLGGTGTDRATAVAVDPSGNVFVAGETSAADFPTTGGFDTTYGSVGDAFVTKVSPTGTLLWSTYLGGTSSEFLYGLAADPSGNVVAIGKTSSNNFPTTTGLDTTLNGISDAFVTKLGPTGTLVFSRYLGGSDEDEGRGVAISGAGDIFVVGTASSDDFPVVAAFDSSRANDDAFVAKLTPAGAITWSSFFGGSLFDTGRAIAVDASGSCVIAGHTGSADLPATTGLDSTRGGLTDSFVAKISGAGALSWATYVGGSQSDSVQSIAVDGSGNVYAVGQTQSSDFPTSGAFDTTYGGANDGFITKLSPSGARLWSSFLGGSSDDSVLAVAADAAGNAFVTGYTQSTDFPLTSFFDTTLAGVRDVTITKITSAGAIGWSTLVGGNAIDIGFGIGLDAKGTVCVGGSTTSPDFPTVLPFDATLSTGSDAFVFCKLQSALGEPCATASDCLSLFCADGVCCDTACTEACRACTATAKGSGVDGTCGNVAADTDPKNACPTGTGFPASCLADGMCDGAGACRTFAKAGVACGATTCASGSVSGSICNGAGSCQTTMIGCAPYTCDASGTECRTSCATNTDCAADAYCTSASTCASKKANGAECSAANECTSGNCVDSVCCNTACTGQCEACDVAPSAGTCTAVTGAPRGSREKCAGEPSVCGGACDGVNRALCTYEPTTKACGCTDGRESTCDGRGACVAGKACAPYLCSGQSCASTCASDADCATGLKCISSACVVPTIGTCSPDGVTSTAPSGEVQTCSAYRCDPATGACRQQCTQSADCLPGFVCDGTRCVAAAPTDVDDSGCGCTTAGRKVSAIPAAGLLAVLGIVARRRRRARS